MTSDYIGREAVERLVSDACEECREACLEFDGIYADCHQCIFERVKDGVPKIPTADVVPVQHAKWQGVSPFVNSLECSYCRYCVMDEEFRTPYCPWCGAVMDNWEDE